MDLVTGDFYVTGLLDFTLVCGEIRNLKAREVVLGYDLSEEEEQILSRQMNLVLSYEKKALKTFIYWICDWQRWSKRHLVSCSSMFIGLR